MSSTFKTLDSSMVSRFDGFYLLKNISPSSGDINLYLNTINGEVDAPIDYEIAITNDNRLVVCFNASFYNLKFNNLIAKSADIAEVVNLQIFERIHRYYRLDGRNDAKSHFFFYNSVPITSDIGNGEFNVDDRCHLDLLGPETFMKDDGPIVPLVDYKHIYVYEPIFSVNGIAHFGYANTNTDIEWYSNSDPFPRITFTLQEGLKQILEWSDVSKSPWNNSETISLKATQLVDALDFSNAEISHIHETQPSMQIFKYLQNEPDARTRPESSGLLTEEIESMVLTRLSHMSFANFIKVHNIDIEEDVLSECVSIQQKTIDKASKRVIDLSGLKFETIDDNNVDSIKLEIFKKGRLFTTEAIMADVIVACNKLNNQ